MDGMTAASPRSGLFNYNLTLISRLTAGAVVETLVALDRPFRVERVQAGGRRDDEA